jgi:hypothetical protein
LGKLDGSHGTVIDTNLLAIDSATLTPVWCINTEVALLRHPLLEIPYDGTRSVWTGCYALLATDALGFIDPSHVAIFLIDKNRTWYGTGCEALGIDALPALRNIDIIRVLSIGILQYLDSGELGVYLPGVHEGTCHHTGLATATFLWIDDNITIAGRYFFEINFRFFSLFRHRFLLHFL